MRTGGLNSLTVVTKPDPDRARPVSLPLRGRTPQPGLRDARAAVRARVISRTCLEQLAPPLVSRHTGLKVAPSHQLSVRLDAAMPTAECRPVLSQTPHPREEFFSPGPPSPLRQEVTSPIDDPLGNWGRESTPGRLLVRGHLFEYS